jgi:hypothetical protein
MNMNSGAAFLALAEFEFNTSEDLLSTTNSPTSRAVEKTIHNLVAKFLPITHGMVTSTLELRLTFTFIIKPKFLPTPVLSPFSHVPELVEFLSPLGIDVPSFDSQDEIVKYYATPDPHDCP